MLLEKHCWAEVSLDALRENFRLVQAAAGSTPVMAVVKANAYGHGDTAVAQLLEAGGAAAFAVADFAEALAHGQIAYIGQEVTDALYGAIEACAVRPGICKTAGLKLVYSPLNGSGNVPVRHVLADIGVTDVTVPSSRLFCPIKSAANSVRGCS